MFVSVGVAPCHAEAQLYVWGKGLQKPLCTNFSLVLFKLWSHWPPSLYVIVSHCGIFLNFLFFLMYYACIYFICYGPVCVFKK